MGGGDPVDGDRNGAAEAPSLLSNGDFESATKQAGKPDDWPMPEGATWEAEDGNHFLRLRAAGPGKTLIVYRVIDVRAEIAGYELRFRVRYTDLKPGKESWHDGRIIVDFKDSAGNKLKPGPQHPNFRGSSKGWETRSIEFAAPQGATKLEIMPALFAVAGGSSIWMTLFWCRSRMRRRSRP